MQNAAADRHSFPDLERVKPYLPPPEVSALERLLRRISLFIAGLLLVFLISRFAVPGKHSPELIGAWAVIFFVLGHEKSVI